MSVSDDVYVYDGIKITTGRFVLNTGLGLQSITGLGFKPKAYITFLTNNDGDDSDSASAAGRFTSIGMTDGSDQFCMGSGSEDSQAAGDVGRRGYNQTVICDSDVQLSQDVHGSAVHYSMDSDGFTINIKDYFSKYSLQTRYHFFSWFKA